MSSIPVVTDDDHRYHDPPYELNAGRLVSPTYERPERLEAIHAALSAEGHPIRGAVKHGDAPLTAVHDPDLVAFLRDGYDAWRRAGGPEVMIADTFRSPRWAGGGRQTASPLGALGWWCFDTATPLVEGSYRAGRVAVDVALTAADLVVSGSPAAYGLTRPPGHHAGRDYFGGFCLFNHAAVAARRLTEGGRVAILDVDVHHGNGTQDIFWQDDSVLYVSLHGHPDHLYPFFSGFPEEVGEAAGRGATRNLPLPRRTDDDTYLDALAVACEVVDEFDPATVVVSLGLDALADDPIGSLDLSLEGYIEVGRRIGALGRPTLVLQEGGYAIDRLGSTVAAVLAAVGARIAPTASGGTG